MFDLKVVKAFNTAIKNPTNWYTDGDVNWDFVDADMFLECNPKTKKQESQFYRMFDDLADDFEKVHSGRTYKAFAQYQRIVDAEYKELFGVA